MPIDINESKSFDKFRQNMRDIIKQVPKVVGTIAVNLFTENFRKQGFDNGSGIDMWQKRKEEDSGRAILIGKGTGALRRSVRILSANQNSVVIAAGNDSDIRYAQIHNEGGLVTGTASVKQHVRKVASRDKYAQKTLKDGRVKTLKKKIASGMTYVKAHTRQISFTMPQRQYMGNSPLLDRTVRDEIIKGIKKAYEKS